jgi:hypothetical protein
MLVLQTRLSPGGFLHTAEGRDGAPFVRGRESRLSSPTVSQGLQRTGNPSLPQAISPNVAPTDTKSSHDCPSNLPIIINGVSYTLDPTFHTLRKLCSV